MSIMSPLKFIIAILTITYYSECIEANPWRNVYQSSQYDNFGPNNSMHSYYNYQDYSTTSTTTKPLYPTLYPQIQPSTPIDSRFNPSYNPGQNPPYNPFYSTPPSYPGSNQQRTNGDHSHMGNPTFGYNNTLQRNFNNQNRSFNGNQNYNNNFSGGISGSTVPVRPVINQGFPRYDNNNRNNEWQIGASGKNGSAINSGYNNVNFHNGYNNNDRGNLNNRVSTSPSFDTDPNGIPLASVPNVVNSHANNLFNYNNLHRRAPNQNVGSNVPLAPFPGQ